LGFLPFRFITRGLGTQETRSNDIPQCAAVSAEYLKRLLDLGYADAEAYREEIAAFLGRSKGVAYQHFVTSGKRRPPPRT